MLLKLEIENFYSIRDRHVLDLRVPLTTPDDGRFLKAPFDSAVRVPSTIAIFGANASGKTSILRALAFIEHFITRSFGIYDPGEAISINSFASDKTELGVTSLAVEFTPPVGSHLDESQMAAVYRYELGIQHTPQSNYVAFERLKQSSNGNSFSNIFDLEREDDGEAVLRVHKDFQLPPRDPRRSVRSNVSLISSLVQFDHTPAKLISAIVDWGFTSNVAGRKFTMPEESVTAFLKDSPEMLNMLNAKLRMIDVGIENVELIEVEGETMPVFHHAGLSSVQTLFYESQGTKSFYCLFPYLAQSLGNGAIASLDEMDSDLHPALVAEVLRWYHDPAENLTRAQLITSCNSPTILNELEKEEIWLTEKAADGATSIIPLSQFAGVRRDTNLYRKYLGGAFGAVPRIG